MTGQALLGGLASGGLYGLLALGFVLILKTTGVPNFAHGEMGMVGAFLTYAVYVRTDNILLAVAVGVVLAVLVALAAERVAVRPLIDRPLLTVAVSTLGLFFIFHAMAGYVWGHQQQTFPSLFGDGQIDVAGVVVSAHQIGVILVTAVAAGLLGAWLTFTRYGMATRALAQNRAATSLLGVPTARMYVVVWGVGIAMATLAAVLTAPRTFLFPGMMLPVLIKAFTAAVLGGLGSLPGAFVGGLLLGVIEATVATYLGGRVTSVLALLIILVVLMVRPAGLIGQLHVRKV